MLPYAAASPTVVVHIGWLLGGYSAPSGVRTEAFTVAIGKLVETLYNIFVAAVLGILQRAAPKRRETRRKYGARVQ